MFEHSQALHAHQQQRHTHQSSEATPIRETSYNPSTSQQHGSVTVARQDSSGVVAQGGGGISHEQLASALAGAMSSSTQGSPLTSLNYSNQRYVSVTSVGSRMTFTHTHTAVHQASILTNHHQQTLPVHQQVLSQRQIRVVQSLLITSNKPWQVLSVLFKAHHILK